MRINLRFALPLVVFAIVVGFFAVGLTLDPRLVPSPLIEKSAPAFDLPELHDPSRTVSLDDLTRKVSLFNVWASWCVACRQEHPILMKLAAENSTPIFGLNYKDERSDALSWLARLGDPYEATGADRDGRVAIDWGVYGAPETFVVDRAGIIRHKHIGPISEVALRNTILPLVRKLEGE
jgi:cytochrome c biogenesis protein CcmG/thiol:disulfide interchange protein DsbE